MSQPELLRLVVRTLQGLGVPYMLTGSVVSSLQGQPRATHDIDVLIECDRDAALRIARSFAAPRFYCADAAAIDAVARGAMFNLIDLESGDKVDFWMRTDSAFDHARFARRQREVLFGEEVFVSTPEDTILAKLRWAKLAGGSEKQLQDAAAVFSLQRPVIEEAYIDQWIAKLNLTAEWKQMLNDTPDVDGVQGQ